MSETTLPRETGRRTRIPLKIDENTLHQERTILL
jgi:hypothetical protein